MRICLPMLAASATWLTLPASALVRFHLPVASLDSATLDDHTSPKRKRVNHLQLDEFFPRSAHLGRARWLLW